jgi:hypothetical protein
MASTSTRTIVTHYYNGSEIVKTNASSRIERAVPNCIAHMQFKDYDATAAEVFDSQTGRLYVQVKGHPTGDISITFRTPIPKAPTD